MIQPKELFIKPVNISVSAIEVQESAGEAPTDHLFHTTLKIDYLQHKEKKDIWRIQPNVTVTISKKNTGEKCAMSCELWFDVETDFDFKKNQLSEITLNTFTELTMTTYSHLSAFFVAESDQTVFNNVYLRYSGFNEIKELVRSTLSAQLN